MVWRVASAADDVVVHISPSWRTEAELAWVHAVISFAADSIAEAVRPIASRTGSTFVTSDHGLVTVYPFRDGTALRREDDDEVRAAAELLARIHRRLASSGGGDRPPAAAEAPRAAIHPEEPGEFADAELDAWWRDARDAPWARGVIHGDYYRRNILCRDRRIVAIVDWHEARMAPLILEVAFATWEMGHDAELKYLPDRAKLFLDAYKAAADLPESEYEAVVPFMRLALRENARLGFDTAKKGRSSEFAYVRAQVVAFAALRTVRLT